MNADEQILKEINALEVSKKIHNTYNLDTHQFDFNVSHNVTLTF